MKISYSLKALATAVASIIQAAGLNVSQWAGVAVAAVDTAGYPKVTHKTGTGAGEILLTNGLVTAMPVKLIADVTVLYNQVTTSAAVSSAATPGVSSVAKSVIIPRGCYQTAGAVVNLLHSDTAALPKGAWQWSGTTVLVKHAGAARALDAVNGITTQWEATVLEYN